MKKSLSFGLLFLTFLVSCSTDLDLFNDYKDIPVVYGLLDARADTNFIRITKVYQGEDYNVFGGAVSAETNNFPEKLDAYLVELKSHQNQAFQPTGRTIPFDTVTVHNKNEGLFYAPDQKLYYCTDSLYSNHGSDRYRYRLLVIMPESDTVTSETSIVSGEVIDGVPILNFQPAWDGSFNTFDFHGMEEAALYCVEMQFNYVESHPNQPSVPPVQKQVTWSYGNQRLSSFEQVPDMPNLYRFYYSDKDLFLALEKEIGNDTVWDQNYPNVVRNFGNMYIIFSAAGEAFADYYQFVIQGQPLAGENGYNNIHGGVGLFSSRTCIKYKAALSMPTKHYLLAKPWGFR